MGTWIDTAGRGIVWRHLRAASNWTLRAVLGFVMVWSCFSGQSAARGQAATVPSDAGPPVAQAATNLPMPSEGDRPGPYLVSEIQVEYRTPHPDHPPIADLLKQPVSLCETSQGYVSRLTKDKSLKVSAPRPGFPVVTRKLSEWGKEGSQKFYATALADINDQIREHIQKKLMAVYATTEGDIDERNGDDLRQGRTSLKIVILTGRVGEIHTKAMGDRVPDSQPRIDHRYHEQIIANSLLQPSKAEGVPGDLLLRDKLDDYLLRLTRHPGRRVDVGVSSGEKLDEVVLEYLVTENKPWYVYAQVSNTGTAQTNKWRERFGFVHNQLTGHDDILSLDYTTAGFDQSQALTVAYEAPIPKTQRLRWRAYGSWSEFTASDVGITNIGQEFEGTEWMGGVELIGNVARIGPAFIDVFGGMRYQSVEVKQEQGTGDGDFLIPYLGIRADRLADTSSTVAEVRLSYGRGDVSQENLNLLGRLNTDHEWFTLNADLTQSFFLEPLLFPDRFREAKTTLAHEIMGSLRTQYAFDYRLIPQAEETLGGFFTVRGYPESALASDTAIIGTAEYRFHIPRALSPRDVGTKKFHWAPSRPYDRPDWDLIFRSFVDVGRALYSDRQSPESDETLVGAGLGVELQVKQNISIRVDWGIPLRDLGDEIKAGIEDSRVHFSVMFLF
ncbi:MAG: hypothetical protein NTU53_18995 [Planctomycetota bacterium]|nr:hypothetical protein [Planctomycetota bacterium]